MGQEGEIEFQSRVKKKIEKINDSDSCQIALLLSAESVNEIEIEKTYRGHQVNRALKTRGQGIAGGWKKNEIDEVQMGGTFLASLKFQFVAILFLCHSW